MSWYTASEDVGDFFYELFTGERLYPTGSEGIYEYGEVQADDPTTWMPGAVGPENTELFENAHRTERLGYPGAGFGGGLFDLGPGTGTGESDGILAWLQEARNLLTVLAVVLGLWFLVKVV